MTNIMIRSNYSKLLIISLFFLVFNLTSVIAANNQMYLLAVSESENGSLTGAVATVELDIHPGKGRVFIDTYPLSKFDTQLSIRYAKEIACKFAETDCSSYDFMYTIRAQSQFIGGPSAGAAISALTFAVLKGLPIDTTIAMTGTINSGRLIGNVGGVKEKIEGAKAVGLKKVLIPIDEENYTTQDNLTIDLVQYGKNLSIEVVPISDLEEAIYQITGKDFHKNASAIDPDDEYVRIMKNVSLELCGRSSDILELINLSDEQLIKMNNSVATLNYTYKEGLDLINQSKSAFLTDSYYSAASYCYGANVKLYYVYLELQNFSDEYYKTRIKSLQYAAEILKENITRGNYSTITSLQTAMIVSQRLTEGLGYIKDSKTFFQPVFKIRMNSSSEKLINLTNLDNQSEDDIQDRHQAIYSFALAVERIKTSASWSKFFDMSGQKYVVDNDILKDSCRTIVADARSRLQYATIYIPNGFIKQETDLNSINLDNDPLDCISKASKIKAEINVIISAFGVKNDNLDPLIERKLSKAAEVINEENAANRFPILGYSYYEYSKSLLNSDKISALLYSEYALEMSNLDLYFTAQNASGSNHNGYVYSGSRNLINFIFIAVMTLIMFCGIIIGVLMTKLHYEKYYFIQRKNISKKNEKSKNKILENERLNKEKMKTEKIKIEKRNNEQPIENVKEMQTSFSHSYSKVKTPAANVEKSSGKPRTRR